MLSIIDTGNAFEAEIVASFLTINKEWCAYSVFTDDYSVWNCLWLYWWHVILIALYFEIKWTWQLRWLLLFFHIRLGFHLQAFSHCHWYFFIDELWNQVSCVIMLLLLLFSLRHMLLIWVAIMVKSTFFSLMNSIMYKYIHIIALFILVWIFILYMLKFWL